MTKPYKYQRKGIRWLHFFKGRGLLADEMGLGKSLQALVYAREVPKARPVVVVCPASVKYNWEREAMMHVQMPCEILEGKKPSRLNKRSELIVINYDILGAWIKEIKRLKPRLVILDEVQYIKNHKAKRTKNVQRLCRGVKKVIALSGTPMTNHPVELYVILNILLPDLFDDLWTFARKYCRPKRTPWGWKIEGAKNLNQLHKLLSATCMIRRTQKQVLKDLPKKKRVIVPLQISNRREYKRAESDFSKWLKERYYKSKATRKLSAERLVKAGYLRRLVGQLKLEAVEEWIENYLHNTDDKLILYAQHKSVLKHLHAKFPNSVLVTGAVTGRKRQAAFDRFTNNKKVRLLFGNIQAAGVGWNGTAATATAHAELSYVPIDHLQAEKRVHRIGQKRPTKAYYLVAHNTIEERLLRILQDKWRNIGSALDGREYEGMDVFDLLCNELIHTRSKRG